MKMEQEIELLEAEYVSVYNELMDALDKLYAIRNDVKPLDPTLLETRKQFQSSLTMTLPMLKTVAHGAGNEGHENELDTRLFKLMEENYKLDKNLVENEEKQNILVKEFSELRTEYIELLKETRELTSHLEKPSEGEKPVERDPAIETKNIVLKELITALIFQSGYQGTNEKIDEWLEYL